MGFVELDRDFIALKLDEPYRADELDALSLFRSGHLKWPKLLESSRVIVLAGAASGKSEEFRQRTIQLRAEGRFALYLTIERLGDRGLLGSLGVADRAALLAWQRGGDPGWFFLDSIDEARINHKDVETALNVFGVDLGSAYDRARVLLSCRGSVWAGSKDLSLISRALPVLPPESKEDADPINPDEALLTKPDKVARRSKPDEERAPEIRLVTLSKVSAAQRSAFLTAEKVTNIAEFEHELFNRGLDGFAERPGDLKTLARYWKKNQTFGDLTDMIEFGVTERLMETNENRRATVMISDEIARAGVERLAAAMTLGQTMDLVLPAAEGGDTDGIDPHRVLDDWAPTDIDGLLQRGIFVPSTFGRIRFFHRSAQECLTARWFQRLQPGLTDPELYRIFLAEPFGVTTIPPALRAAAGWIAQSHDGLREHILEREPLVLLEEGDPGRLSRTDRAQLLATFASRQLAGDLSYRMIDHRALWMFADDRLAPAILDALEINGRPDFLFEMLRLIEQGRIKGCEQVLQEASLQRDARPYHRIVATRAMVQTGYAAGLAAVAADLLSDPAPLDPNLAPALTLELFPDYLTVDQLVEIIGKTKPARQFQVEGFREELLTLYERCREERERQALISGLVELAIAPPLDDWPRTSRRNAVLVSQMAPLAKAAVVQSDNQGITGALVALLRAVGRARDDDHDNDTPTLQDMVQARPLLKQALFWADVAAEVTESHEPVRTLWHVGTGGVVLWSIGSADADWLTAGLARSSPAERLVALDSLIQLARHGQISEADLDALSVRVAEDTVLAETLAEARRPHVESEADLERRRRWDSLAQRQADQEEGRRERWRALRTQVQGDPEALRDSARLATWPGPFPLLELTRWLGERADHGYTGAALKWDLLEAAYGRAVAQAYRDGMKVLWRVTPSERPKARKGLRTVKYTIILSMAGLAVEAAADEHWATKLTADEVRQAGRHVCLDDQTIPDWLGALLEAHPQIVAPMLAEEMKREWRSADEYGSFLERAAHNLPLVAPLRDAIVHLLSGPAPRQASRVRLAAALVPRLALTCAEQERLSRLTLRRLAHARKENDWTLSLVTLRLLFQLCPERAALELLEMLEIESRAKEWRARELLRSLFHRHHGSVVDPAVLGPSLLGRLVAHAYALRPPPKLDVTEDDDEDGTVDSFDDPRNTLLSALITLDGEETYRTVLALADNPIVGDSAHRFRELAREIAERSADRQPWPEGAVREFEARKLAPIATGGDLLELVCALLDDVSWTFRKADMSARAVVETAADEAAIQEWLGAELQGKGGGRFQCHREAQVAESKRPDITVTATSAAVEVAIEIKHDEKGWTLAALRQALHAQLAEQYLQPANRRHGVLVITNHRDSKYWRDANRRRRVGFAELISILQSEATTIVRNSAGSIKVEVRGLDAAPGQRVVAKAKDGRKPPKRSAS